MLAFQPDEGPSAKPRGISTVSSLVGRESVVNEKTSATRKIPGSRFHGVIEQVGSGCRRCFSKAVGKKMRGMEGPLIQAVFSKERKTSIALGKGLGVKNGFRGVAKLGLGANILESYNRAIMAWFGWHRVDKGFTIRDVHQISQSESEKGKVDW